MAVSVTYGRKRVRPLESSGSGIFQSLGSTAPAAAKLDSFFPRARKSLSTAFGSSRASPGILGDRSGEGKPAKDLVDSTPRQLVQSFLDLGQKEFRTCRLCEMTYTLGVDDEAHKAYCKKMCGYVRFPPSLGAPQVAEELLPGIPQPLRVLCVSELSSGALRGKVDVLRSRMEEALGSYESRAGTNQKTFVGVIGDRAIACVVAERITRARRAQTVPATPAAHSSGSSTEGLCAGTMSDGEQNRPATCPSPGIDPPGPLSPAGSSPGETRRPGLLMCGRSLHHADLGISHVWVHEDYRRLGVASRLVDAARRHCVYGCTVPAERVAFSQPTESGWAFAASYSKTDRFLIYG